VFTGTENTAKEHTCCFREWGQAQSPKTFMPGTLGSPTGWLQGSRREGLAAPAVGIFAQDGPGGGESVSCLSFINSSELQTRIQDLCGSQIP
jgi:hypothetical protein